MSPVALGCPATPVTYQSDITLIGDRQGVWHALAVARCASTPDLPAVAFTSDYSRPGFLRMGFLPITRFTLWTVCSG